MINPKKVRLMTKLAVYEEGPGKKDLRINGYSKRTYVNIKQLESVIAITAAYILAMVLYCFGIYTDIMSRGLSFPLSKVYYSCSYSLRYYSCSGYCMYKAILHQSL